MEVAKVEHASRIYKIGKVETQALRDVSLTIESGEFTALVGRPVQARPLCCN